MATQDPRQIIHELLDDTLETLYYQLTMSTDMDMDTIKGLIKDELKALGLED